MGRRAAIAAALALIAVTAAGCGSSSSSTTTAATTTTATTTTPAAGASATETWATGVCSAITTWKGSITTAATSVTSNPSKAGITSAANDAKAATQTLGTDLKGLGKPDTAAGEQAQTSLNQLSTNLSKDVDTIQTAVSGASGTTGVLSAAAVVGGTLTMMGTQVTSTVSGLQSLSGDSKGELKSAFTQSSACTSLTK